MKNSYKLIFIMSMMFGTLIAISANSWLSIWMGLEINLLSFIPLMMSTKNLFSSESSLKYFLTQALASAIFLISIILYFIFLNFNMMTMMKNISLLISSAMLMKSGAAPFHFWFPSVMEGLSWDSNLILISWQKIAPLMILSYLMNFFLLIFVIFMSMIFSLGGLNQLSLRKLMAFSSINHLGWMMAGMMLNEFTWLTYFIFYIFLSFSIIFVLNNFKLFFLNQIFKKFFNSQLLKLFMFIPLLSLGGLPPFVGFFPKWMIIEMLISYKMYFLMNFMLFLTLIALYFYLRLSYAALLFNYNQPNWTFKINFIKMNLTKMMILCFFSIFGLILINLFFLLI